MDQTIKKTQGKSGALHEDSQEHTKSEEPRQFYEIGYQVFQVAEDNRKFGKIRKRISQNKGDGKRKSWKQRRKPEL